MNLRDVVRNSSKVSEHKESRRVIGPFGGRNGSLHRSKCLGLRCTHPSPAAVGQEAAEAVPQARPAEMTCPYAWHVWDSEPGMQATELLSIHFCPPQLQTLQSHQLLCISSVTRGAIRDAKSKGCSLLFKHAIIKRSIDDIYIKTSGYFQYLEAERYHAQTIVLILLEMS